MQRGAILTSASFSCQHDAKLMPASVFYSYWRDAEFILASAFPSWTRDWNPAFMVLSASAFSSRLALNADLAFVASMRRESRVCYSRVCHSCNANPASAIPASVIPVSVILAMLTPASATLAHSQNPRLPVHSPFPYISLSFSLLFISYFMARPEFHGFRTFRHFW